MRRSPHWCVGIWRGNGKGTRLIRRSLWRLQGRCIRSGGRLDMSRYPILIAPTRTGYSAHVPNLPGCVAAGRTLNETKRLMAEAIEMHLAGMREDGDDIPEPSLVEVIEVA